MTNPRRLLWCDAEANCHRLSTREGVKDLVEKAQRARVETLIVDVKPLGGEVLYKSRLAPRLGAVEGRRYPESFDLLAAAIEEGKSRGIRVHAAINVFSEGHREWGRGPAYEHPEWQVTMYEGDFRSAAESRTPSYGIFVNPIGPARDYELAIIEEIVSSYEIDGIILDRMRYPNLYADFSESSRAAFEKWLGRGPIRWPDDVFTVNDPRGMQPIQGKHYKEWLEWRAWQIRDFAAEATTLARSIRPAAEVAVYVGSWYESYYDVGVNWGSKDFHGGYPWMTPTYNETGFAEMADYICTGCYYPVLTRAEARAAGRPEGATVEAACDLSRTAIRDAAPVYGSLYLRDYGGNPDSFRRAMEIVTEKTDGIMLFDLVYLEDYGWWPLIEEAFSG